MKKIQKIYISCCKNDLHLTKICVASIRYWYPNIPIFLVKDQTLEFNTSEIEKFLSVSILNTPQRKWRAFTKLEAFFIDNGERALVIDSDIIFIGKIIDTLEGFEEDFVVSGTDANDPNSDWVKEYYMNFDVLKNTFDQDYDFPGFVFNTGQMVITCGKINKNDFLSTIDWSEPPVVKRADIFKHNYEQGVLNYVLIKKAQAGEFTLKSFKFKTKAADTKIMNTYELSSIRDKKGYPVLIHWMIQKAKTIKDIPKVPRGDLLLFYQEFYNSKIELKHNRMVRLIRFFKKILYI